MVTLMRFALRFACDTQYTDRQTNRQTDQQPHHLGRNPLVGRRVRTYKILHIGVGNRERFALRLEGSQWVSD